MDASRIAHLEPVCLLSPERQKEIASLCFVEKVSKDIDPFRMNVVKNSQSLYLLTGNLAVHFVGGKKIVLRGGTDLARYPVGGGRMQVESARALTDIEIVRIDTDLLDIMMTWDQLAGYEQSVLSHDVSKTAGTPAARGAGSWMKQTGVFSAGNLQSGVFSRLPPANIDEMFRRMTSLPVKAGQVIILQGAEGDYYYLIESGIAVVTRITEPGATPVQLAELKAGDAFGEEALVSDNKRNATVTMKTDGVLLRLDKQDFIELLKEPLINAISWQQAEQKVATGAIWLDVRFPSEYKFDHLPNAINAPLHEIRSVLGTLDKNKTYITYCQTGRRSSAAAFILAQHGFDVFLLEGGTKSIKPD
ncbi:MAG: cyclic nucleotide-binding domain-containing protein [Methylophilaceae bacterium]|nr:cyclic nucleotide-binding domain-containing protein [Methylophilaceae bacterium]